MSANTGHLIESADGVSLAEASGSAVPYGTRSSSEAPKQDSVRTVTLDSQTRKLRQEWRAHQNKERDQWCVEEAWVETNRVWTHENGEPLQPD
jgi:hypothetical protein